MENKTGVVEKLPEIAFGIFTFALIVGIGVLFLGNFAGSVGVCNQDTATVTTNNLIGYINSSGFTLTGGGKPSFTLVSIVASNYTSGLVIASGNYTTSAVGVVTNLTAITWDNVTFNYTYTWSDPHELNLTTLECLNSTGGDAQTPTGVGYTSVVYLQGNLGQSGLAGWVPAIIAFMVGMLFLAYFLTKNKRQY